MRPGIRNKRAPYRFCVSFINKKINHSDMDSLDETLKDLYNKKKEYKRRDEISYHLPEWIHLMVEYFDKNYAQKSLLYKKKSEYEKRSKLYKNN